MIKRLLPLVMALSIAAAPLAVAWCQITCAETAAAAAPHSCHHHSSAASTAGHAAVGQAASLASVPHACGHDDEVPASQVALDTFAAPATITQIPAAPLPVAPPRTHAVAFRAPAPIPPLLQTPLRV